MAVSLIYTKKGTPFMDQYKKTAEKMKTERTTYRKDQANLRDAFRKQTNESQTNDINKSNEQDDASGRQNYVNYMQAQKRLPGELNALGIRGGASESSLIRLGNTYGTNVATNEAARGSALAGIKQTYAQKLSDYDRDYRTTLADYDRDYNSRLASAYATAYQNQINWEKEQQQKDLEYFSGAIEGLYGDTASYDSLISQLEASSDPNKEYKIMLARKARQTLVDKLAEEYYSSGGGGGGYSSGGGGGYSYGGGGDYSSSGGGGGSSSTKSSARSAAKQAVRSVTKAASNTRSSGAFSNARKRATYSKYKYWG